MVFKVNEAMVLLLLVILIGRQMNRCDFTILCEQLSEVIFGCVLVDVSDEQVCVGVLDYSVFSSLVKSDEQSGAPLGRVICLLDSFVSFLMGLVLNVRKAS